MTDGEDDDDFFNSQSEASLIKARIVSKYFDFWCNVIGPFVERLEYVDLYSGPGTYRDGQESTPMLILRRALQKPEICKKLVTHFNDADPAYTAALARNIAAIPGIENLKFSPRITTEEIGNEHANTFGRTPKAPSFSFVDPFGYKGVSLELLHGMLKDWGSDLVLFFSYNRINAALNNPVFRRHVVDLFGEERVERLLRLSQGISPRKRESLVLEEFAGALGELGCKYVLPFTFRRPDMDRTSHHLILVTKKVLGYGVMKEIMAKESSDYHQGVPSFAYAKPLSQYETPLLFELDRPLDELEGMLLDEFAGRSLAVIDVYDAHHVGRRYIKKNYKDVLARLAGAGVVATDRKPKRAGTFAEDIVVTFPPKKDK